MYQQDFIYDHDGLSCKGFLAFDDSHQRPRPVVLVVHDWSGRNEFACQQAIDLASLGYVGFAVDMYGKGQLGERIEEKQALMMPLVEDRILLVNRLMAALDNVKRVEQVDKDKIGAIGFCFGGLCVLDLARSGADIAAVVSLHGLLNAPENADNHTVKAKVMVLHGYDDPMVEPPAVQAFCDEMTQKQVDWQVHMYGGTKHAFTNPNAHDEKLGTVFNEQTAARALQTTAQFLDSCLLK